MYVGEIAREGITLLVARLCPRGIHKIARFDAALNQIQSELWLSSCDFLNEKTRPHFYPCSTISLLPWMEILTLAWLERKLAVPHQVSRHPDRACLRALLHDKRPNVLVRQT
jgi:hypothetical protein